MNKIKNLTQPKYFKLLIYANFESNCYIFIVINVDNRDLSYSIFLM